MKCRLEGLSGEKYTFEMKFFEQLSPRLICIYFAKWFFKVEAIEAFLVMDAAVVF
eukprot:m.92292 g.92292  ORF g.92292 m.92292 type:complete len:55 (-) comp18269_c0_seq5:804-968(-)